MEKCKHEKKRAMFMSVNNGWRKTDYRICEKCNTIFKKEEKEIKNE